MLLRRLVWLIRVLKVTHPRNHWWFIHRRRGTCLLHRLVLLHDRPVQRIRQPLLVEKRPQVLDPLGPIQQPRIVLGVKRQRRDRHRRPVLLKQLDVRHTATPQNNRIRHLHPRRQRRLVKPGRNVIRVQRRHLPTCHLLLPTRTRRIRRHIHHPIDHLQRLQIRIRHRLRHTHRRQRNLKVHGIFGNRRRLGTIRPTLVEHIRHIGHAVLDHLVGIVVGNRKPFRCTRHRRTDRIRRRHGKHKGRRKVESVADLASQVGQAQVPSDAIRVERTHVRRRGRRTG